MVFASVMAIIFPVALAATPVHPANIATRWALYCKILPNIQNWVVRRLLTILLPPDLTALSGTCAGITWTWVNETNRDDPEKRAYTSALVCAFLLVPYYELPTVSCLIDKFLDERIRLHLHRLGPDLHLPSQPAAVHCHRKLHHSRVRRRGGDNCTRHEALL